MATELRNQIMDASEKLFLEKGYHATSMREIAALCGIQVGNLNYYFRKKEDILMLHHNHLMDTYCSNIPTPFFSEPWSGYIAVEYCFLRAIAESPSVLRLYSEVINVPSLRKVYFEKHHELFLRFFSEREFALDSRELYFSTVSMCSVEFNMIEQFAEFSGVVPLDCILRYVFSTRLATLRLEDDGRIDHGVELGRKHFALVKENLKLR